LKYESTKQRSFNYLVLKLTFEYDAYFVEKLGMSGETGSEFKFEEFLYAVSVSVIASLRT
jgi:hypothetical protein